MAYIEVNGKKIEALPGSMIIEVIQQNGISIPHFCYHKKLSVAANCRMCLVEVERAPKPLPACATPITDGMKVWTRSPLALTAQQAVMEFLLINHPLDCPICDQGGECELQDNALGYGKDVSRFREEKRTVLDKNLGSLIATDMTRCIQCTRCVRFGTEIAGMRELGATGRGEKMEIGTFIEHSMTSEVSGNVIDLCPVGALTSKPFRFTARAWELTQHPSIAPHDCVGSHIYIHSRQNHVMRVVPREQEAINEVWISDRDRFSYEALDQNRLTVPKIKQDGHWVAVSWTEALEHTVRELQAVLSAEGPSALGALASPSATTEELYLLQKFMRGLGSHNIDHRLRQLDFRDQSKMPAYPHIGLPFASIQHQSTLLLIGSEIRAEQPILALKLRQMALSSGEILLVNPIDFPMNFDVSEKMIVEGGDLCGALSEIAKALLDERRDSNNGHSIPEGAPEWLAGVEPTPVAVNMAKKLMKGGKTLILIGALGLHHPEASRVIALANLISQCTGATFGALTEGANSAGAWLAGCIPHRLPGNQPFEHVGLTAREMSTHGLKGYVLLNVEPDLECANGGQILEQMGRASFTVALTCFDNGSLSEVADVLLPICPFTENSGSWMNAEGNIQIFRAAVNPLGEARPAWKILRVLGNLCKLPGFDQSSVEAVFNELQACLMPEATIPRWDWWCPPDRGTEETIAAPIRIGPVPINAVDSLVRRATALQQATSRSASEIRLNPTVAKRLNLLEGGQAIVRAGQQTVTLKVTFDGTIPDQTVLIPAGIKETVLLGEPYTPVDISRAG